MSKKLSIVAAAENGKAVIKIKGPLSNWRDSADNFERSVQDLIDAGVQDALVYMNTIGGSTFEAFEIVNIVKRFPGTLTCELGSVCASAGTIISSSFDFVKAATNTQFMVHRPMLSIEGNEDEIKSGLKLLENTKKSALDLYVKKTGQTDKVLDAKWQNDWWMSAAEAKAEGFVDEVDGEAEVDPEAFANMDPAMRKRIPAAVAAVLEPKKKKTPENKSETMKTILITAMAAALNMKADSSQEEVMAQVEANADKAKLYDNLVAEKINSTKTALEASIKTEVDAAVADKKITAEQSEMYTGIGKASGVEALKQVFSGMTPVKKISAETKPKGKGEKGDDSRKDWTYADFQEKDPTALGKMHKEDPEAFEKLYNANK